MVAGRTALLSAVLVFIVAAALVAYSGSLNGNQPTSVTKAPDRYASIPSWAPKYTPQNDSDPPVLHSSLWETPVPMPGPINTAGAEDSPFITPDGKEFFFFFTPNLRIPAQQQVGDGVTGIWWSHNDGGSWSEPARIYLGSDQSLDGCEFVQGTTMWFCSVRAGNYRSVDLYTAQYVNGNWANASNAGRLINSVYQVGEMTISPDNNTMYYGSGGEIWALDWSGGNWTNPHLVPGVQMTTDENQPFVTPDGGQLWFTGDSQLGYPGPAVFLSSWNGTGWGRPTEVVSRFAGEPTLDSAGNLYFVHHFLDENGSLAEADIYVAYRVAQTAGPGGMLQQAGVPIAPPWMVDRERAMEVPNFGREAPTTPSRM